MRRNTIQGSVFSHTIELSPNINRSASQSSVETNQFFPGRDSGYVDNIQLKDSGPKENNDNVVKFNEDERAKANSLKFDQRGKEYIKSFEKNGIDGSSSIKQILTAVSNEMLPTIRHQENIKSTINEGCDKGFKESAEKWPI